MAYATYAEVQSEFRNTTFASGKPVTPDEVNDWLDEFSALIDGRITKKFALPVSDASLLLVLKLVCKSFVAARIKRILNADDMDANTKENSDADKLEKMAKQILDDIMSGKITFTDAAKSAIAVLSSYNVREDKDPKWEMDVDQW